MVTFCSPPITSEDERVTGWPTLGDYVAEWIETYAVFGPGTRFGERFEVDDEFYSWLCRAYQVWPAGHAHAGYRRFGSCWVESAKGTAKTEKALAVAQAEFHPSGPVRCAGWTGGRYPKPIPGPVPYPRLFFLGTSAAHVERTAWGRFRQILKESPLAGSYHNTADKIVLVGPDGPRGAPLGESMLLPVSPNSLDGDLPTWMHIDEPHRYTMTRHHEAVEVIENNAMKDPKADTWMMATSTAGRPGGGSVLEAQKDAAEHREVERAAGRPPVSDRVFYYRRHASELAPGKTIETIEQAGELVAEARGPNPELQGNVQAIAAKFFDPTADQSYLVRVWLGWWRKASLSAFDTTKWSANYTDRPDLEARAFVTLGFDGALTRDATALVATDIKTGYQQLLDVWERPHDIPLDAEWRIDEAEVSAAVVAAYERFDVWRGYYDPAHYMPWLSEWQSQFGESRVVEWWTNRDRAMASALRNYKTAIDAGQVLNDGDPVMAAHIGNANRKYVTARDGQDRPMWVIRKDRPDSPRKIDAAMAGCLSWEARTDAIASGAKPARRRVAPVRVR